MMDFGNKTDYLVKDLLKGVMIRKIFYEAVIFLRFFHEFRTVKNTIRKLYVGIRIKQS